MMKRSVSLIIVAEEHLSGTVVLMLSDGALAGSEQCSMLYPLCQFKRLWQSLDLDNLLSCYLCAGLIWITLCANYMASLFAFLSPQPHPITCTVITWFLYLLLSFPAPIKKLSLGQLFDMTDRSKKVHILHSFAHF